MKDWAYNAPMTQERGRVSDEAVQKATGHTWAEWFAILEKAGAKKMGHTDIAHYLSNEHIKNGWWAQMVTVEYERVRGRRKINENAQGFYVSMHKTATLSVPGLEKAWEKLLKSRAVASRTLTRIASKTKRKMLRYKADVGGVVVSFDPRGSGKSRILVEAIKLPSKASVERERAFWKRALAELE